MSPLTPGQAGVLVGLAFLPFVAGAMPRVAAERAAGSLIPSRLAIYYGYPSLVNGSGGDPMRASVVFADYDVVVFGDGLEFGDVQPERHPPGAGAEEHRRTRAIIQRLRQSARRTAVYGYVDLGNSQQLSSDELERRVRLWAAMGVTGIFLDEAGYDFGVTRDRQNAIVRYIHTLGLKAFLNAFDPDDVFGSGPTPINSVGGGNPAGRGHALGANDAFLLESFQIRHGEYEDPRLWAVRTAKAAAHRDSFGTSLFAATTTDRPEHYTPQSFAYAWWSAVLWDLDGFGWGEPGFSGSTSQLPWRPREPERRVRLGTRFTMPVVQTSSGFRRRTDNGTVILRLTTHEGEFVPGKFEL